MASKEQVKIADMSSPLVPPLAYLGVLTLANIVTALAPQIATLALVAALIWLAAVLFLFVTFIWFREDDWREAGILLGVTVVLGGHFASVIARTLTGGFSIEALGSLVSLGTLLRLILMIPLCGGVVFLARRLTRMIQGDERAFSAPWFP